MPFPKKKRSAFNPFILTNESSSLGCSRLQGQQVEKWRSLFFADVARPGLQTMKISHYILLFLPGDSKQENNEPKKSLILTKVYIWQPWRRPCPRTWNGWMRMYCTVGGSVAGHTHAENCADEKRSGILEYIIWCLSEIVFLLPTHVEGGR